MTQDFLNIWVILEFKSNPIEVSHFYLAVFSANHENNAHIVSIFKCQNELEYQEKNKKSNQPIVRIILSYSKLISISFISRNDMNGQKFFSTVEFSVLKFLFFMNIINSCGCLQKDKIIRGWAEKKRTTNRTKWLVRCVWRLAQSSEFRRQRMWNRDTNRKLRW